MASSVHRRLFCCILEPLERRAMIAATFPTILTEAGASVRVTGIGCDLAGSVYVAGHFSGSMDFQPGSSVTARTGAARDGFIAAYSQRGKLLWVHTLGGPGDDRINALSIDNTGAIAVAGTFSGTVDFDPGPGARTLAAAGQTDVFVARYTTAGELTWVAPIGGGGAEYVFGLSSGPAGEVSIAGTFEGTCDFNPGSAVHALVTSRRATFLCVLSTRGRLAWVDALGPGAEVGGIAYAADYSVYTCGGFSGSVDFNPLPTRRFILAAQGEQNGFVARYGPSGRLVWVDALVGPSAAARAMTVDAAGNAYTVGTFERWLDLDPGPATANVHAAGGSTMGDLFISKLDSSGARLWGEAVGATADIISDVTPRAVALAPDASGVLIAGGFTGRADFDPRAGRFVVTSQVVGKLYDDTVYSSDAFVLKLSPRGVFVSAQRCSGLQYQVANAIAVDREGSIYTDVEGSVLLMQWRG